MLRGIFTGHIGTKDVTRLALEAEERRDYYTAQQLYKDVNNILLHLPCSKALLREKNCDFSNLLSAGMLPIFETILTTEYVDLKNYTSGLEVFTAKVTRNK